MFHAYVFESKAATDYYSVQDKYIDQIELTPSMS